MAAYEPSEIEPRWQRHWQENDCFRAGARSDLPKYYVLDMFPYPSGCGPARRSHPKGYTATDVRRAGYKRMKRLQRAAPDRLGRVRPAGRAVRHSNQGTHPEVSRPRRRTSPTSSSPAAGASASPTTGTANSARTDVRTTTSGRSGSSRSCSSTTSPTSPRRPSTGVRNSAPSSRTTRSSTARVSAAATTSYRSR